MPVRTPLAVTTRVPAAAPTHLSAATPLAVPHATVRPAAKAMAATVETADSRFASASAAVVRAYLAALARGDDASARASLDAPSGSRASKLSEKEFAGPGMHIAKIEAHGTGDDARVDVDIDTPGGSYFAQFFLKRSPTGAAVIVNHDFIKP
jgi:hypothetical protein